MAVVLLFLSFGLQWVSVKYFPIRLLSLKPCEGMTRAELWYIPPEGEVQSVVVLCPGFNGNARSMVGDCTWQEFAKERNWGLVGLSFASENVNIREGQGYYYVHSGSGELLLKGIGEIYGREKMLYLYGFSGGGHFSARFMAWRPELVSGWCAYAVGWWDTLESGKIYSPGIVACGLEDVRYDISLNFFRQGYDAGLPWLWCSVAGAGHEMSPSLESFARKYFAMLEEEGESIFVPDAGFLPGAGLLPDWKKLNGRQAMSSIAKGSNCQ